ncbi:MAG: hypothetical protein K8R53_04705, partial [Bacteroidales bacterium]|nr:hypothetical protein [Bacteroidales bacterium]
AMGMDSRDNSTYYHIKFDGWNEANAPYLVVDYTYNPPYTWLTLDGGMMVNGTVPEYSYVEIDAFFDADTLPEGVYEAEILVNSNDPNEPLVTVPVTLTIATGFNVSLKVYLEGPYNSGNMNTYLCQMPEFSLTQPYNTSPWFYPGQESVVSVPNNNIVDWVLVELRDAPDAASATGNTMIAQQAGFILNDGSIVGLDGSSLLQYNVQVANSLFVVICHRNHLDIMSGFPLTLNGGNYTYDFSIGADQVYGGFIGYKDLGAGIWGMVGGDGLPDGQVSNSDKVDVWIVETGSSGYYFGDFNLDGQVNNVDKVEVWAPNSGSGSQVPDGGFKCQIPE